MKHLKIFKTEEDVIIEHTPCVYLIDTTKELGYVEGEIPVKIQHIDGTLYSSEEWIANSFTNDLANGIVVNAEKGTILIAKEQKSAAWGAPYTIIEGTKEDFGAGENNTNIIIAALGENEGVSYAALEAYSYIFPDGQRGFLPSTEELIALQPYLKLINKLLLIIGGSEIGHKVYSTSYTDNYLSHDRYSAKGINFYEYDSYENTPYIIYNIYRNNNYPIIPIKIINQNV